MTYYIEAYSGGVKTYGTMSASEHEDAALKFLKEHPGNYDRVYVGEITNAVRFEVAQTLTLRKVH